MRRCLFGPCESFELVVGGGDEQVREHALLDVASGFEFDPALGVTYCGETTGPVLAIAEGPNAMVAVRDIEALGIELWPRGWLGSLPSMTKRSEEHTSEIQSLMRTSYAVFRLKKKNKHQIKTKTT